MPFTLNANCQFSIPNIIKEISKLPKIAVDNVALAYTKKQAIILQRENAYLHLGGDNIQGLVPRHLRPAYW